MSGILWDALVFGPIKSRRLGNSLGVNLLPGNDKICTFNCVYCECGWGENPLGIKEDFNKADLVLQALENKLQSLKSENFPLNSITFAGNGEPTLHPDFPNIVDRVIQLRNRYFPNSIITCLSNSTTVGNEDVRNALMKLDNPWMKLDAGSQQMFSLINQDFQDLKIDDIVNHLAIMKGKLSIQTLFLRGVFEGQRIDNTTKEEMGLWLSHLAKIKPQKVIIYPIDRATPLLGLEKIEADELEQLASKIREAGFITEVYY
jgi:wyosine [tRNA(Phe)-imidazoG37] synthetase (radical SAM superfamily)